MAMLIMERRRAGRPPGSPYTMWRFHCSRRNNRRRYIGSSTSKPAASMRRTRSEQTRRAGRFTTDPAAISGSDALKGTLSAFVGRIPSLGVAVFGLWQVGLQARRRFPLVRSASARQVLRVRFGGDLLRSGHALLGLLDH